MMFWVGTTDTRWFEFLAPRHLDEVNFWQPSVRPAFENAPSGMPFVFKVKRPHNHIAGAGYFITRSVLPLDLAWEIFGQKNGAASSAVSRAVVSCAACLRNQKPRCLVTGLLTGLVTGLPAGWRTESLISRAPLHETRP